MADLAERILGPFDEAGGSFRVARSDDTHQQPICCHRIAIKLLTQSGNLPGTRHRCRNLATRQEHGAGDVLTRWVSGASQQHNREHLSHLALWLERDLDDLAFFLGFDFEELTRFEVAHAGNDVCRELFDAVVHLHDGVVVVLASKANAVLG